MLLWFQITSDKFETVKKGLGVLRRFEALKFPFSFSNDDVRILNTVVQPFAFNVFCFRKSLRHNRAIKSQPVGSNAGRSFILAKELREESLGCLLISSVRNEDIEHGAVGVYCSPQVVFFPCDFAMSLVNMPASCGFSSPLLNLIGKHRTEASVPLFNSLVAHHDSSFKKEIRNISK